MVLFQSPDLLLNTSQRFVDLLLAQAGALLDTILVAADWSLSKTFKCFYLRSPDMGGFARAVLAVVPE